MSLTYFPPGDQTEKGQSMTVKQELEDIYGPMQAPTVAGLAIVIIVWCSSKNSA